MYDYIFSAPHEDLKALIAQAHRSVYRRESVPVITDLIDNIMSIPSCLQDANSKVSLVREWIKQNPKTENIELPEPVKPKAGSEKLNWNDTPKDAVKKDHISDDDELDPPDPDERLPDIGEKQCLKKVGTVHSLKTSEYWIKFHQGLSNYFFYLDAADVIVQPVTPKRYVFAAY